MKKQSEFSELKSKLSLETTGEFKNLELTDEQFVRLITLLKIGLRVVGYDKSHGANVPLIDIDQYISSFAKQFNADHLVQPIEEFGDLYICREDLSKTIDVLIQIYGDHFIQEELSHKLATRDLIKNLDSKSKKPMKVAFKKIKAQYSKEFKKNDLENITLKVEKSAVKNGRTK